MKDVQKNGRGIKPLLQFRNIRHTPPWAARARRSNAIELLRTANIDPAPLRSRGAAQCLVDRRRPPWKIRGLRADRPVAAEHDAFRSEAFQHMVDVRTQVR